MKRLLAAPAAALALSLAALTDAAAQGTQAFMNVPNIAGGATADGFHGWIDLYSVSQSFAGAKTNACTAVVTKGLDQAGPKLWAATVSGQALGEVTITITRPTGEGLSVLYELVLTNTIATAISSTPSALNEQVTLVGNGATLRYYTQAPDGSPQVVSSVITCR